MGWFRESPTTRLFYSTQAWSDLGMLIVIGTWRWHFEVHRRPAFMQEHLFVPHWPAQLQWTYPYPPLQDTSFDNARREMISMVFQPFKVSVNPIILGVHFLRQTSHWEWTVAGDHVCRQGDENSQMNSRRSQPQPRPQWPQFWLGQRPRD